MELLGYKYAAMRQQKQGRRRLLASNGCKLGCKILRIFNSTGIKKIFWEITDNSGNKLEI